MTQGPLNLFRFLCDLRVASGHWHTGSLSLGRNRTTQRHVCRAQFLYIKHIKSHNW